MLATHVVLNYMWCTVLYTGTVNPAVLYSVHILHPSTFNLQSVHDVEVQMCV
jgi:hypothetical protein